MKFFDAEMVEMIMVSRPKYFEPKESEITIYENADFEQIPHMKKVVSCIAENILNTAQAIEIKYGKEKALKYVRNVMKKGA